MDGIGTPMFTIQRLSGKIDELIANQLDVDAFEDWFVSESWGYYDVHGGSTSDAIAAVHHVLSAYKSEELEADRVARELANAVRPFVQGNRIQHSRVVRNYLTSNVVDEHSRRPPINLYWAELPAALAR